LLPDGCAGLQNAQLVCDRLWCSVLHAAVHELRCQFIVTTRYLHCCETVAQDYKELRSCVTGCVAVCCSVLQCVCCSVLHGGRTGLCRAQFMCDMLFCSVLQCVAGCCRVCVAVCCIVVHCGGTGLRRAQFMCGECMKRVHIAYLLAKEPHILAKEPYLLTKSPIFKQKNSIF